MDICAKPNKIEVNTSGNHLFFVNNPKACNKYPLKKYSSKLVWIGTNTTAIKHTAGGSNGGELANADFNNIDRNTVYSSSTSFGANQTVTFTLNAAAATQIINENDFNVALLLTHDSAEDEESPLESDGSISNQIAFGSTIQLSYTDPASGYGHKVNAVASANIGKVNTVATANIGKINTVD